MQYQILVPDMMASVETGVQMTLKQFALDIGRAVGVSFEREKREAFDDLNVFSAKVLGHTLFIYADNDIGEDTISSRFIIDLEYGISEAYLGIEEYESGTVLCFKFLTILLETKTTIPFRPIPRTYEEEESGEFDRLLIPQLQAALQIETDLKLEELAKKVGQVLGIEFEGFFLTKSKAINPQVYSCEAKSLGHRVKLSSSETNSSTFFLELLPDLPEFGGIINSGMFVSLEISDYLSVLLKKEAHFKVVASQKNF